MNKSELIASIAKASGLSKAAATRALDAFIKTVGDTLGRGVKIVIPGFGVLSVAKRKKREGRNPLTGEPITIPAAKVAKFKAGKKLKEKVNK